MSALCSCGRIATNGRYCAACARAAKDSRRKQSRDLSLASWRGPHGFRAWLLSMNAQCARIENGERCTRPGEVLHHIIERDIRPDLTLDPANIAVLCRQCHDKCGAKGTPWWKSGIDYEPTRCDPPRVA